MKTTLCEMQCKEWHTVECLNKWGIEEPLTDLLNVLGQGVASAQVDCGLRDLLRCHVGGLHAMLSLSLREWVHGMQEACP